MRHSVPIASTAASGDAPRCLAPRPGRPAGGLAAGGRSRPMPPRGLIRSAGSGPWSAATTWEGGAVPAAGARVQVRAGHTVRYDVASDAVDPLDPRRRDAHLRPRPRHPPDVGLIKIQAGDDASEDGFDCDAHLGRPVAGAPRPALEVGTADRPIGPEHTAVIRLAYVEGMDRETCPAIVCCGGRMDFHGAPMSRTWVKLGATAAGGAPRGQARRAGHGLAGRRPRDRHRHPRRQRHRGHAEAEAGRQGAVEPRPGRLPDRRRAGRAGLHRGAHHPGHRRRPPDARPAPRFRAPGRRRLSRRGREPEPQRRRRVGRPGRRPRPHDVPPRLGRLDLATPSSATWARRACSASTACTSTCVGDTMRGSSVVGASIWDSGNRWITIHGTNYLVVRDCVGYQSGRPRLLPRGRHRGLQRPRPQPRRAGVRRASSCRSRSCRSTRTRARASGGPTAGTRFTRNVACENDRYGYRFEATPNREPGLTFPVLQPDGSRREVDIRTLPFVRFEGNESHCDGKYGLNLGEGVDRVGPDHRHPFVIKDMKIWKVHYAFRPESPSVLVDGHDDLPGRLRRLQPRTTTTTSTATCRSSRRTPSRSTAASTT